MPMAQQFLRAHGRGAKVVCHVFVLRDIWETIIRIGSAGAHVRQFAQVRVIVFGEPVVQRKAAPWIGSLDSFAI